MHEYLVTIIMPVFNAEGFIKRSVLSVIAQTHENFELLVVDDCSTDSSVSIVREAVCGDERVKFFSTNVNSGGPATPRNIGLDNVNGDYLAFIDSDDVWHQQKLTSQLLWMKNENIDFSFTGIQKIKASNQVSHQAFAVPESTSHINFESLLKKNVIPTSTVVCRSTLINASRFSIKTKHIAVEDYLFWLHLHKTRSFRSARLSSIMTAYIEREDSLSRNKVSMAIKVWKLLSEPDAVGPNKIFLRLYYFSHYIVKSLFSPMYT